MSPNTATQHHRSLPRPLLDRKGGNTCDCVIKLLKTSPRRCAVMKEEAEGGVEEFIYPFQHPTSPDPYIIIQPRGAPGARKPILTGIKSHTSLPLCLLL
jgi:hypothetical protein